MSTAAHKLLIVKKGGPGSGHFGHAGRKGQRGGSVPGGGSNYQFSAPTPGEIFADASLQDFVKNQLPRAAMHEVPGLVKAQIVDDIYMGIPPELGVTKDDVNNVLASWANTSNDHNMKALSMQEAASEEFGVELSTWQQENISKWLVDNKVSSFDEYINEALLPQYSKSYLSRTQERAVLRSMYNNTQARFAAAGYRPDDVVLLHRGVQFDSVVPSMVTDTTKVVNYQGNAMESWSSYPAVARSFAWDTTGGQFGVTLSQRVPVRNIIGSCRTGFGCLSEEEFVTVGNIAGSTALITGTYGG